jgi:phosphate transport system substrate-binding protein
MTNDSRKGGSLSQDAIQMIRGLVIGELVTVAIIGGLWLWLRPRLQVAPEPLSSSHQGTDKVSAVAASNFQSVTNVPIGFFKYGGSTAWAPIRQFVDSQIQVIRPELQLRYVNPTKGSPGSGAGIRMLLDGKLDFTESSRPLTDAEYDLARQRGFTLKQYQVGIDGIAVVVNPNLKVPGLTIEQLQKIYLGEITNWKQVGGQDLAIAPFSQYPENADTMLLGKQSANSHVRYVYSNTEALHLVNQTLGGLYYASARGIVHHCLIKPLPLGLTSTQLISPYREPLIPPNQCPQKRNQLNTEAIKNGSYPITTKLFVIIKQNQGREQQVGEAYTKLLQTEQGQKAIEQAGFVPEKSQESVASSQKQ